VSVRTVPSGALAAALTAARAWLLEPAEPRSPEQTAPALPRPVIAVFGLARGCGVTMVARALAAELAARDGCGTAAVSAHGGGGAIPLASGAAFRLARLLADVPGADVRAVGRLCLVRGADDAARADAARHFAPLVIDAGSAAIGGAPAALADSVVLVAPRRSEPALAALAADCIARVGPPPIVVLNRARADPRWRPQATLTLPDARAGAQLALAGREARGALGAAVAQLADLSEAPR
jgi:hypothetical protein